jgi:hypothetical protein
VKSAPGLAFRSAFVSEKTHEPIFNPLKGEAEQATAKNGKEQDRHGLPLERVNKLIELLIRHRLKMSSFFARRQPQFFALVPSPPQRLRICFIRVIRGFSFFLLPS